MFVSTDLATVPYRSSTVVTTLASKQTIAFRGYACVKRSTIPKREDRNSIHKHRCFQTEQQSASMSDDEESKKSGGEEEEAATDLSNR